MQGMRWAGQHFPPTSCRGTGGEPTDRAPERPSTLRSSSKWPTSGVLREQASSLVEGSRQAHRCDCPGPSLGLVVPPPPTPGCRARTHTPRAMGALGGRQRSSGPHE